MELYQLRYFSAVAEHGNFTRAAESCHVSQPSLSQQIINLENELGHKLFHRLGRRAVLTEAGTKVAVSVTGSADIGTVKTWLIAPPSSHEENAQ